MLSLNIEKNSTKEVSSRKTRLGTLKPERTKRSKRLEKVMEIKERKKHRKQKLVHRVHKASGEFKNEAKLTHQKEN